MPTNVEVFNRINVLRGRNGRSQLSYAPFCLHEVGVDACQWVIAHNSFQHPPNFPGRVAGCNDNFNGEILLWRCPDTAITAANLCAMWMASPEHKTIILSPDYQYVGIAHVAGNLPSQCRKSQEPAVIWAGEFGGK